MSESRRPSRRGRRDSDLPELDEDELIADLRARAWAWLQLRVVAPSVPEHEPEPEPEAKPAWDPSPVHAPANDAGPPEPKPAAPPRPSRRPKRDLGDPVTAFRRKAWWWLRPAVSKIAEPSPPEPPKRKRAKREALPPDGVKELRRRAWAWFAPQAGATGPKAHGSATGALPGSDIVRKHLKGVLEAVIFASEHPLPARELARIAGAEMRLVKEILAELVADYQPRGVRLDEIAGGFVFRTSPAFAPFVREQVAKKPVKMTRAQIETLAIVAYRQPITRPEVDEVRGVDSGAVLKSLLDREVVRIIGKKDEPGRPLLYGTTPTFLELFGLRALGDLPTLREFTELTDESKRTYEREMAEAPLEADSGLMGGEGAMKTAPASAVAPEQRDEPEPQL